MSKTSVLAGRSTKETPALATKGDQVSTIKNQDVTMLTPRVLLAAAKDNPVLANAAYLLVSKRTQEVVAMTTTNDLNELYKEFERHLLEQGDSFNFREYAPYPHNGFWRTASKNGNHDSVGR